MITIELNNNYGRLSRREPFIMPSDGLSVAFKSSIALGEKVIRFTNGSYGYVVNTTADEVQIPEWVYHAGELNIDVSLVVRGQEVKHFQCEPIILKQAEQGFAGSPEFDEIKNELIQIRAFYEESKIEYARITAENADLRKEIAVLQTALEQ